MIYFATDQDRSGFIFEAKDDREARQVFHTEMDDRTKGLPPHKAAEARRRYTLRAVGTFRPMDLDGATYPFVRGLHQGDYYTDQDVDTKARSRVGL